MIPGEKNHEPEQDRSQDAPMALVNCLSFSISMRWMGWMGWMDVDACLKAYRSRPVTSEGVGATSRMVRLRAPWAPWMITPSMSPVAEGPAMKTP